MDFDIVQEKTDNDWSVWMGKPAKTVTCLCGLSQEITSDDFCVRCGQRLDYNAWTGYQTKGAANAD